MTEAKAPATKKPKPPALEDKPSEGDPGFDGALHAATAERPKMVER